MARDGTHDRLRRQSRGRASFALAPVSRSASGKSFARNRRCRRPFLVNGQPLDPNKVYTVAIPDFVLKQGDGYTMFTGQPVRVGPEAGNLISAALEEYVTAKSEIAPAIEARITIH